MTRVEWERLKQCQGCKYFDTCLVKWGIQCKRQHGKKIPRLHFGLWVYEIDLAGNVIKRPRGRDIMFG